MKVVYNAASKYNAKQPVKYNGKLFLQSPEQARKTFKCEAMLSQKLELLQPCKLNSNSQVPGFQRGGSVLV